MKMIWVEMRHHLVAWVILFGLTLILQYRNGAYASEFGNHPDEAAHYVTGIMVHDFFWNGDWCHPRLFAENYYVHYPKVAIGHWPPFFYLLQAVWMSIFPLGRTSLVLFMAVLTTSLAMVVYRTARGLYGTWTGLALGGLFLLLPPVQRSSAMVMADILVAFLCLKATLAFARFLDQGRWQDAFAFGLWSSMSIMTKGTGLALALVPVLAILFSRRFSLIRRWSFWLPAFIVVGLCGPWYYLTLGMVKSGWFESTMSWSYSLRAISSYSKEAISSLGVGLLVLGIIGLIGRLNLPSQREVACGVRCAFDAWAIAYIALLCIVPCGVEQRFLLPILPVFMLIAAAGANQLAQSLTNKLNFVPPTRFTSGLISLLILAFIPFSSQVKSTHGYAEPANRILEQSENRSLVILVAADSSGEGMFVSEIALRDRQHLHVVLRTSKVLSSSHWVGKDFKLRFATTDQVARYLVHLAVDFIVLDMTIPRDKQDVDQRQLLSSLQSTSPPFRLAGKFPLVRRDTVFTEGIHVYCRQTSGSSNPRILRVPMEAMLGRTLEIALP